MLGLLKTIAYAEKHFSPEQNSSGSRPAQIYWECRVDFKRTPNTSIERGK